MQLTLMKTSKSISARPLQKRNNSHHSITYHSYFYHLFTLLLLHHSSHTTISFSRRPQLISLTFIPSILTPCPLHLTCNQHMSIILFLSFSQTYPPFPLRLPKFLIPSRTPERPSGLPSHCKQCLHAPGCWVAPSFLWF